MIGITFDTGAPIALERRRPRMAQVYRCATSIDAVVMASAARFQRSPVHDGWARFA